MLLLGQTEQFSVNLTLTAPLNLLVVSSRAVGVGSTHMATQCLPVSENFPASLTDEFSVTLLLNYLSLGNLSLLVSLLDEALNRSLVYDIFALRGSIHAGI